MSVSLSLIPGDMDVGIGVHIILFIMEETDFGCNATSYPLKKNISIYLSGHVIKFVC